MPTLLEAAKIKIPESVEGQSFFEDGEIHQEIHGEHVLWSAGSFQWITDGRKKYIWMSKDGGEQLFDLEADPFELNDLARDPGNELELNRWREKLVRIMDNFEEGFVEDGKLVPGKSVKILLDCLTKENKQPRPAQN